ncbi:MAG: hypothetical protein ABEJ82_04895 [Haloplanus sp.]
MGEDRLGRRGVLGVGVGLLTALAGCGRIFVEEPTPTSEPSGSGGGSTPTPTPAPTVTDTQTTTQRPTRTATATPTPLPGDVVEIRSRQHSVRRTQLETHAYVDYRFVVENVGDRTVESITFRVTVRYEHEDVSRVVATGYQRPRFDYPAEDDAEDDEQREGLQPDEEDPVTGRLRFERDGRAEHSTDDDRFELELAIHRLTYRSSARAGE